ncbi:hypothetical protein BCR44DRAFT_271721 [Catenaria anguillulae PL171]|uniref:Uncharacterized protein n=1 Tax=Catenaria anguillulae PL171 TaxID=765915 RepID=A0A1Y2HDV5_9FUNG|nr:hypothetical protein BCR44DRAFT_271721 [Catenaria anguillulae PL171]
MYSSNCSTYCRGCCRGRCDNDLGIRIKAASAFVNLDHNLLDQTPPLNPIHSWTREKASGMSRRILAMQRHQSRNKCGNSTKVWVVELWIRVLGQQSKHVRGERRVDNTKKKKSLGSKSQEQVRNGGLIRNELVLDALEILWQWKRVERLLPLLG